MRRRRRRSGRWQCVAPVAMLLGVLVGTFDHLRGCRVGEASNPGPTSSDNGSDTSSDGDVGLGLGLQNAGLMNPLTLTRGGQLVTFGLAAVSATAAPGRLEHAAQSQQYAHNDNTWKYDPSMTHEEAAGTASEWPAGLAGYNQGDRWVEQRQREAKNQSSARVATDQRRRVVKRQYSEIHAILNEDMSQFSEAERAEYVERCDRALRTYAAFADEEQDRDLDEVAREERGRGDECEAEVRLSDASYITDEPQRGALCFCVRTPQKDMYVTAESKEDKAMWMSTIRTAIANQKRGGQQNGKLHAAGFALRIHVSNVRAEEAGGGADARKFGWAGRVRGGAGGTGRSRAVGDGWGGARDDGDGGGQGGGGSGSSAGPGDGWDYDRPATGKTVANEVERGGAWEGGRESEGERERQNAQARERVGERYQQQSRRTDRDGKKQQYTEALTRAVGERFIREQERRLEEAMRGKQGGEEKEKEEEWEDMSSAIEATLRVEEQEALLERSPAYRQHFVGQIAPDGNCLYRCLAVVAVGTTDGWGYVKRIIAEAIRQPSPGLLEALRLNPCECKHSDFG